MRLALVMALASSVCLGSASSAQVADAVAQTVPIVLVTPEDEAHAAALVESASDRLDSILNDYPTARFRNVRARLRQLSNGVRDIAVCGEMNAKNGFGAYTGWVGFALMGPPTDFFVTSDNRRFSGSFDLICASEGAWVGGDVTRAISHSAE